MKYVAFVEVSVTTVSVPPVILLQSELLVVLYHVDVSSNIMLVRPLHPENAYLPMLVTLLGIVILVRPVQFLNA